MLKITDHILRRLRINGERQTDNSTRGSVSHRVNREPLTPSGEFPAVRRDEAIGEFPVVHLD